MFPRGEIAQMLSVDSMIDIDSIHESNAAEIKITWWLNWIFQIATKYFDDVLNDKLKFTFSQTEFAILEMMNIIVDIYVLLK